MFSFIIGHEDDTRENLPDIKAIATSLVYMSWIENVATGEGVGFVFGFQISPTVIFFSALTSLLYYLGVLQFIVKGLAGVMSRAMKLSGEESLAQINDSRSRDESTHCGNFSKVTVSYSSG